jgi:uncharacterized protein YbcI
VVTDPDAHRSDRLAGGQLQAAISNAMVQLYREYLGRGPDRARTSIRDNTVVVLMEDTLTKAERTLVSAGKDDTVMLTRLTLQGTMRNEVIAAIERLTGRKVVACMSGNHIGPDLSCEVIVLEPETRAPEPAAGGAVE